MKWIGLFLCLLAILSQAYAAEITFRGGDIEIELDSSEDIHFEYDGPANMYLYVNIIDDDIAKINSPLPLFLSNVTDHVLEAETKRLGETLFTLCLSASDDGCNPEEELVVTPEDFEIIGIRPVMPIDAVFGNVLLVMILGNTFAMGCKTDPNIVIGLFKEPKGITIGACCQFGIMPFLGFVLAKILDLGADEAIGLMIVSSSPGGGLSNVFTHLLNANLELSLTMTFTSTVLAMGMMPLMLLIWADKAGQFTDEGFELPFLNIVLSLLFVSIPVLVGMGVRQKFPNFAFRMVKCITPMCAILILVAIGTGAASKYYIFDYADAGSYAAALLLPLCGMVAGFSISYFIKLPRGMCITVALETGIQNALLAVAMIERSFDQPDADQTSVIPLLASVLTIVETTFLYLVYIMLVKYCGLPPMHPPKEEHTDIVQVPGEKGIQMAEIEVERV